MKYLLRNKSGLSLTKVVSDNKSNSILTPRQQNIKAK